LPEINLLLETSALGMHWSFSPCTADPQNIRWGRSYEGFSQSAKINADYVEAYIKGMQGETLRDYRKKIQLLLLQNIMLLRAGH